MKLVFIACCSLMLISACSTTSNTNLFGQDKSAVTVTVDNKNVSNVSGLFVQQMVRQGFRVEKQTKNSLEFIISNNDLLSALGRSVGLQQYEKVNCSLVGIDNGVSVSCRSFNVADNNDGTRNTDEQTHVKKYRNKLISYLDQLKQSA